MSHLLDNKMIRDIARSAYNQGKKDEYAEQNPNDDAYYSMRKKKTFTQWLKKYRENNP